MSSSTSENDYDLSESDDLGPSSEQESDSDLEELYASFDFEDDVSQVSAAESASTGHQTTECGHLDVQF